MGYKWVTKPLETSFNKHSNGWLVILMGSLAIRMARKTVRTGNQTVWTAHKNSERVTGPFKQLIKYSERVPKLFEWFIKY